MTKIQIIDGLPYFIQEEVEFQIMNRTGDHPCHFHYDERKERERKRQEWLQSLSKRKARRHK